MAQVTLRFRTDDDALIESLGTAWLEDEGIVILHGGRSDAIDLTYVRAERG